MLSAFLFRFASRTQAAGRMNRCMMPLLVDVLKRTDGLDELNNVGHNYYIWYVPRKNPPSLMRLFQSLMFFFFLLLCVRQFLRTAGKTTPNPPRAAGKGGGGAGGKGVRDKGGGETSVAGGSGSMKLPDKRVNHNITCEHGRLVGGYARFFFCALSAGRAFRDVETSGGCFLVFGVFVCCLDRMILWGPRDFFCWYSISGAKRSFVCARRSGLHYCSAPCCARRWRPQGQEKHTGCGGSGVDVAVDACLFCFAKDKISSYFVIHPKEQQPYICLWIIVLQRSLLSLVSPGLSASVCSSLSLSLCVSPQF